MKTTEQQDEFTPKQFHREFMVLMKKASETPLTYKERMEIMGIMSYGLIQMSVGLSKSVLEDHKLREGGEEESHAE
jgi:hypothetical protein